MEERGKGWIKGGGGGGFRPHKGGEEGAGQEEGSGGRERKVGFRGYGCPFILWLLGQKVMGLLLFALI